MSTSNKMKKVTIVNKNYVHVTQYHFEASSHRYRDENSCQPNITTSGQHMSNITLEILDLNTGSIPGLIHSTNKNTANFSVIEGEWRIPIERITTMTAREVLAATGVIMM